MKKFIYILLFIIILLFFSGCEFKTDIETSLNLKQEDIISAEKSQETTAADNIIQTASEDLAGSDIVSETFGELLRTNEFFTSEQIEGLKTKSLSWKSVRAGIGRFADIIAIKPEDNSAQQVFISFYNNELKFDEYEKIQIQPPDGTQANIIYAGSGAGSGELVLGYKFIKEDSEWIEFFYAYAGNLIESNESRWENVTKYYDAEVFIQMIKENKQFE